MFFDDFEQDRGWTRNGQLNNALTGLWERANPQGTSSGVTLQVDTTPSGVNALVTGATAGASAGVNDVDAQANGTGGVTSIISPSINLPSGTLTLSFQFYMAHLSNSSAADFFRVSIMANGVTTQVFQEVGAANNDAGAYALQSVNISQFAGQTVQILIQAADISTGGSTASLVEAAVDNVRITNQ